MAISHSTHSALATGARIGFAARLRQVASADDAQPGGQRLQQNRHQVRKHQDPQKLVAEARAAFEVGGPVARIHVADADQVRGAREGEHSLQEVGSLRRHAAMNF